MFLIGPLKPKELKFRPLQTFFLTLPPPNFRIIGLQDSPGLYLVMVRVMNTGLHECRVLSSTEVREHKINIS